MAFASPCRFIPSTMPSSFHSIGSTGLSGRRRLADGTGLRPGRITQAEDAARIVVEELPLVGVRERDLVEQLERGRRIPARIVGAVHHMVDAVVVDGEF